MQARLVEGWRQAWRWWSMWMHAVGTMLAGTLLLVPSMPQEVQDLLPAEARAALIALWFAAGVYVRVRKQGEAQGGGVQA